MEQVASLSNASVVYEISGDGPPFVWCHGLGSCRDGDRDVIDAFAEHFTVLSYDARGHGRSAPVHDASKYSHPALSQDLRELLDHVGWDHAILAGASMGAGTAIRVAMEQPQRPLAVTMARPASSGGPAPDRLQMLFRFGAAAIRSGGLDAAIEFLLTIPEARDAIDRDPARLESLRRDWERHDPLSIAAALEGIPPSPPVTPELDPQAIVAPVLVIPGNDPIHPTQAGLECVAIIPGARATEPFDSLPRPQETALFVQAVRAFLEDAGI